MRFELRSKPSRIMVWCSPLISLSLTAIVAMIIFASAGLDPLASLVTFLTAPLVDLYGLGELLIKAAPLVLIAIGLAIGFRAGIWNVGAEGQLTVGVIFSGYVALHYGPSGSGWVLPAMVIAGAVGGMVWAAIPAWLRVRFNANEILVSLMLNYVAALWLSWLIFGAWRDPAGFNFPQSEPLAPAALFPTLIEGTRANASIIFAVVAVVLGWIFASRSFAGFQLKVTGLSEGAARYAGFSISRAVWIGMLVSGAVAGISGVGEIAGPLAQIFPTASPGYGYSAIIVAFLGRLNPIGILLSGLLMALLYLAGDLAQMSLGMPSSITGLLQSTLLFFLLTTDVLVQYRIRLRGPIKEGASA
ncbi:simple sugar transport system permease protein [Pararhizobium capsulatum DSM 1112]|uniref:Simple sugar transport system permease protein n=1 Tax=Pararhizobium capsulatum DSM 1112 TaxID=1121113 RepID=A0ABU0BS58_9HYPH|nr:ABC transporter permease [Pararhizobium capsulatum]MDQ0321079.1 simple sugar transport system permease protein [Pararhizobium capsulatum DSM 1112]